MLYTNDAIKQRKIKIQKVKSKIVALVYILLVPILIYNISLIIQAIINPNKTPSFFGIKTYVIISGSMMPDFQIGDVVIAKNIEQQELQVGDIISFRQGTNVITHRIVEKVIVNEEEQYKTKGDNNNTQDSGTISYELIEGKVIFKIPYIGKIALLLRNKLIIILVAIVFYIYLLHSETHKKKKEQRRRKRLEYEENKMKRR